MSGLQAAIERIALLGPGLAGWEAARAVLAGAAPYARAPTVIPPPELLPANERRRSGQAVRIALAVGGRPQAPIATVFASSTADGDNCHAICEQLAGEDRLISPTRFHNSVHNAPAGYWSIATRDMSPSTSLCAYDGSFAAGLLEACALVCSSAAPVLLVAYDATYPEPLRAKRPVPDAFGLALTLAPVAGATGLARIALQATGKPPAPMRDAALEALRLSIPTARSLPLLALLARAARGATILEYLDGCHLEVEVAPCA
jgi:hypothetical protein